MDKDNAWAIGEGMSAGAYLIVFFVGLNFVFELLFNVVFSPAIVKLISLRKK